MSIPFPTTPTAGERFPIPSKVTEPVPVAETMDPKLLKNIPELLLREEPMNEICPSTVVTTVPVIAIPCPPAGPSPPLPTIRMFPDVVWIVIIPVRTP